MQLCGTGDLAQAKDIIKERGWMSWPALKRFVLWKACSGANATEELIAWLLEHIGNCFGCQCEMDIFEKSYFDESMILGSLVKAGCASTLKLFLRHGLPPMLSNGVMPENADGELAVELRSARRLWIKKKGRISDACGASSFNCLTGIKEKKPTSGKSTLAKGINAVKRALKKTMGGCTALLPRLESCVNLCFE